MKEYEVYGHTTIACVMRVKANSREEAIEKANDEFGSLTNYVGMGGSDKLIGVNSSEDNRSIFPDSDVAFDDCKEM